NASRFTHLPAVRKVCKEMGIELEIVGRQRGKPLPNPEDFLPSYDLVFAKARCALEAMAVGAAVVLCDVAGAGPLVTPADFDWLRRRNFGRWTLRDAVRPEVLARQIERYDASSAAEVTLRVRAEASLDGALEELAQLYREVIAEQRQAGPADAETEGRAA